MSFRNNSDDYITIVPKSLEDGKYERYSYTRDGNPLKVEAPMEPGECEIRYQNDRGGKVLARIDLKVVEPEISLKAPSEVAAGTTVSIEWTGPNNSDDYITIVPKTLEDGKYANYAYTRDGSPLKVEAPTEPGECEIRYQSDRGSKVLARIGLKVVAAEE